MTIGYNYDFRSDTVTQPTEEMKAAMMAAPLGDDVYGEDPTTNLLQERFAEMAGKEAALFFPSGSMANLAGLMALAPPGSVVYAGHYAHIKLYELGSYGRIGGLQLTEVNDAGGYLHLEELKAVWHPDIYYMPKPGVIEVENTQNMLGGLIYPREELKALRAFADEKGVPIHMDGARLFHAAAGAKAPISAWTELVDTVMVSLSKGLGGPVGSLLAGSRQSIEKARTLRKLFGGGMRQAGILAAAGLYAFDNHLPLLEKDNQLCYKIYEAIKDHPRIQRIVQPQTNILIFYFDAPDATRFEQYMKKHGILLSHVADNSIRIVTHLCLAEDAHEKLIDAMMVWE